MIGYTIGPWQLQFLVFTPHKKSGRTDRQIYICPHEMYNFVDVKVDENTHVEGSYWHMNPMVNMLQKFETFFTERFLFILIQV